MANEIGNQKSVSGHSTNLNTQQGQGGVKPSSTAGKTDPGGHKPPKPPEGSVPWAAGGK